MTRYATISADDTVTFTEDKPILGRHDQSLVVMLDDEDNGSFALLSDTHPEEYWFLGSLDCLASDAREAASTRMMDE